MPDLPNMYVLNHLHSPLKSQGYSAFSWVASAMLRGKWPSLRKCPPPHSEEVIKGAKLCLHNTHNERGTVIIHDPLVSFKTSRIVALPSDAH